MSGGCLIIEHAEKLSTEACGTIADYVKHDDQNVAIVLQGEEQPILALMADHPQIRNKFLNIIHIGKYNEKELVELAKGYAKKKGYEISEPAANLLRGIFARKIAEGQTINYEDVITTTEEAIARLEKRNMKNLFMTVLDNKYKEAAMFELLPDDFEL
jgi:hypothetical protein